MDPQPRTANGSGPLSGSGDWRDPEKLSRMSISELVFELRDTFRKSDFDRVEETLLAREARLMAEIEEQKKEIGLLQDRFDLERLEKINVELELKRVMREKGKDVVNGFGFDGKNVKVELGCESGKLEGLKKEKVGDGDAGAEVKEEKVELLAEKKKIWDENPSKKDGLGASVGKLAMGTVIDIEDSDEEMYDSHATLNGKETTSCIIADNKHLVSSGAVQENLATRLDKSIGTLKRGFFTSLEFNTNINILDGLDSDSSSSCSSSSSGSLDIDNLPLRSVTSNKKMRTMQSLLDRTLN